MPSLNEREINRLRAATKHRYVVARGVGPDLVEKRMMDPTDNFAGLGGEERCYAITEYGRRVLAFYDAIKAGRVKRTISACHGCANPC